MRQNHHRVLAIGMDSADPTLIEKWIDQGELPHLRRLKQTGSYARLKNQAIHNNRPFPFSSTEGSWVMFQTGVSPATSGYWDTISYDPRTYQATSDPIHGGYDYSRFPPFYAMGKDFRIATLDVPVSKVCPEFNGVQIVGWGGHFPFVERGSHPANLLQETVERYGPNEVLYNDYGVFWNKKYLRWLEEESVNNIRKRTKICLDLLEQEPWDLMLPVFSETHGASHDLWFMDNADHPLHHLNRTRKQPLLNVFRELDSSVGRLIKRAGDNVNVICFSVHGMQSNVTDVGSFFVLPELMYRFNFPGKRGFADGDKSKNLGAPFCKGRHWYWFGEIWRRKHVVGSWRQAVRALLPGWLVWPPGKDFLFPYQLDWFGPPAGWMPGVWYQPAWPRMRSFCLPSFADGQIRFNLIGREAQGVVHPDEYETECQRIIQLLSRVVNPRTGAPVVRHVVRTRGADEALDSTSPLADLTVIWADDPFDAVDSPDVGRIGPVPYYRTGGHRNEGFMLAAGPGIRANHTLPNAGAIDLAPTILQLMRAPIPKHLEGQPIPLSL